MRIYFLTLVNTASIKDKVKWFLFFHSTILCLTVYSVRTIRILFNVQKSADMAFCLYLSYCIYDDGGVCTGKRTRKKNIYSEKWKWNRFWHTDILGLVCENSKWKTQRRGRKSGTRANIYYILCIHIHNT